LNTAQHKIHFEFEYRMISASGEIVWIQDIVTVHAVEGAPTTLRGFLIDITERKKVELELEREKEILQTVFDHIPVMVSLYAGTKTLRTNHLFEKTLGWSLKEVQDKDILALCYPDPAERQEVLDYIATAPSGWKDFKTATREGRVIDTSWANVHLSNGLSVGIGQDITRRKRSEEALRENERALLRSHQQLQELARKLLSVQEEERRRISRDLHDDLNQQLATLSIAIGTLKRNEGSRIVDELSKLQELVKGISDDVRAMSRELHPASLEHLGLVAALETHCGEFCEHECVECTLSLPDDLQDLPSEVALCLYRIAQEGLRNIGKHSKAKKAHLRLSRDREGVRLFIRDDGVGFEPDRVSPSRGLGLTSMEERARLLQGNLNIKSQPGLGTEIEVFIPLSEGA
jgi:PAS domain S-box-containing protein